MGTYKFIEGMKTVRDALETYLDMYEDDVPDRFRDKLKNIIWVMKRGIDKIEKDIQNCPDAIKHDTGATKTLVGDCAEQKSETLDEQIERLKKIVCASPIEIPEPHESVFFGYSDADIFKVYFRGMQDAAAAAYYFSDELAESQECDL